MRSLRALDHALSQQYGNLKVVAVSQVAAPCYDVLDVLRPLDPVGEQPTGLERRFRHRAHGHLPWVEIVELAAHRPTEQGRLRAHRLGSPRERGPGPLLRLSSLHL